MENKQPCGFHCIKIQNLGVRYGAEEILNDVNIHIHCGQLTVVIGKNGAGKTTLLKAILNEIKHEGSIQFIDTRNKKSENLKIGYVPQSINMEKHMPTTVYDLFASLISNKPIWVKKDKKLNEQIIDKLKMFEIENLINKSIGDLSGGELQKVLLAVATTPTPNLLILDEPVSGIDKNGIKIFYELVNKLKKVSDMAIILVSHDLEIVRKYADKFILLDKTIVKEGTAEEVFNSKEYKKIWAEE